MSFVKNDAVQMSFNDSLFNLTSRELALLEKSWAKPFAEKIFPKIREEDFSVLYSEKFSRPNTPVNVIVGALILKELLGLTDDETLNSLIFDVRFQYALHTTSFEEQPLSDRSFSRFRRRCLTYEMETGVDLIHDCIIRLSEEMAALMKIDGRLKRMDSLMVASNIRKLSRMELLYSCVSDFVQFLHQTGQDELLKGMEHYYESDDYNRIIYHESDDDFSSRMATILADAGKLLMLCEGGCDDIPSYQLLVRVIREQTTSDSEGNLELRSGKDNGMKSDILQNPSDPDATFRQKAGESHRGYAANITESVGQNGTIITEYQYDKNNKSDSGFLSNALEKMSDSTSERTTLVADGAYSSRELKEKADRKGIDLITTDLKGRDANDIHADFIFSEDGIILKCPAGFEPKSTNYRKESGVCKASFKKSQCENCPHRDRCQPKILRRVSVKYVSRTASERAREQRFHETNKFKALGRIRNGIETIPSILRRKYRIDEMPVRGYLSTKSRFGFKIGALNFNKLFRFLNGTATYAQNPIIG